MTDTTAVTKTLAHYIVQSRCADIPADVRHEAARALLNWCGCAIGAAGGTLQAASRTMMVFHTTPDRATEAFGLYALSGKATTYLGTMGIALFTLISGSQRLGIAIPLIALFVLGMVFLKWVKPMGERS